VLVVTVVVGPAEVAAAEGGLGGAMVKLRPLTVPPVDVEVVAPVDEVDAAGVGPPVVVFVVTLLLLVVPAGVGPPVVVLDGAPFTDVVAAGTGIGPPVEVVVVEPLVFVVAAGDGPPVVVLLVGAPFAITVAAATLTVVSQAPRTLKFWLVLPLYVVVGAPAPTVVTVLL